MKYILAVSGGVDSVVLLDMMVKEGKHEIIVAHFDHGIRSESDADARFVRALAERYELPFETRREELGSQASEELARTRRYEFLREVAKKHEGMIATAHHQDDILETIAINIHRGTGWRGLAVLDNADVYRPLLATSKRELRQYASEHNLEWIEDETNATDKYLRNRIRGGMTSLPAHARSKLIELWNEQLKKKGEIDEECIRLMQSDASTSRYFFTHIDEQSATELLRAVLLEKGQSLTIPQRVRLLHAIKVAKPGARFEAGTGVIVRFTASTFIVEHR